MRFEMHPINPQIRLMKQVVEILRKGGIIVFPTDAGYSVGCFVTQQKKPLQRLYRLKREDKKYQMTLMVHDFTNLTEVAEIENPAFRYMKSHLPGPYTFILPAQKKIWRILDVKRPEVGIRMPEHVFFRTLGELDRTPLLCTTARLSDDEILVDPEDIEKQMGKLVDLIVDMGPIPLKPTTVISLLTGEPIVIREGD